MVSLIFHLQCYVIHTSKEQVLLLNQPSEVIFLSHSKNLLHTLCKDIIKQMNILVFMLFTSTLMLDYQDILK